ncbi:OVARIAN TUMOR DOMAIN-containing deubiquitinating enzyme 1 isoform X2 [Lolium perenne]|uniref:OVARIAN TUMOR DOMAIN-containing deubiquitinating enzyme 1 isoform X2 n=1 Tax=Lolium perenne TaxID=4522 RepID=UPI0021F678D4|nr:OVARIAN TUMOR DOMAIN-containing deubiquitinating enzyme 1-like isoform X2 [Lolium perenne]
MEGRRPSPHADDPTCGGGGANSSITPQEPEVYSPPASPPRAHHSGQPGRSIFVNEDTSGGPTIGAASSSAWGPVEGQESKITDKTAAPFLLGPRRLSSPTGGSDSDSDDDDCDTWGGFSDRTRDGASTSLGSPDAYDCRTFFADPAFQEEAHHEILGHSFWRHEDAPCDDEPLSSLESEFAYDPMKDKSNKLLANYSEYRKVAGDGSCFYRSFIYSYLELLVKVPHEEELRLIGTLEPLLEKFQRLDLPGSYYHGHDAFVNFILKCMDRKQTLSVSDYEDWLFQESQNDQLFANIISYLRLVTAIQICTEVEKFRHAIPELDPSYPEGWCRQEVIPMHKDAFEVHVVALTDVLQVPLRTVNVDISKIAEPNTHIYESPDASPSVPCVTLLYRPGHYDIIY